MLLLLKHLIVVPLVVLGIVYVYFQWCFRFWKRKGLPQVEPSFPFGNRHFHKHISYGEDVFNVCLKAREQGKYIFGIIIMKLGYVLVAIDYTGF